MTAAGRMEAVLEPIDGWGAEHASAAVVGPAGVLAAHGDPGHRDPEFGPWSLGAWPALSDELLSAAVRQVRPEEGLYPQADTTTAISRDPP